MKTEQYEVILKGSRSAAWRGECVTTTIRAKDLPNAIKRAKAWAKGRWVDLDGGLLGIYAASDEPQWAPDPEWSASYDHGRGQWRRRQ